MREEALNYVQNQLTRSEARLGGYLQNAKGTRNIIGKIRVYHTNFLNGSSEQRWVIMPGLRGVGKTTIMAQTYFEVIKELQKKGLEKNRILFISLDDATVNLNISLNEILEAYERVLEVAFEKQQKPFFIFIDEAQYDSKWGVALKVLYDKTKFCFIFCTGSSALELRSNPDVVRRSSFEKLYPMNFTEFGMIRHGVAPIDGLKEEIKDAVYESGNVTDSFQKLQSLQTKVVQYWSQIDSLEIENYLEIGTFPFAFNYSNKSQFYEALNILIDKIIHTDVPRMGSLKIETIAMMRRLLYLLADANDAIAVSKLAKMIETNGITLAAVLDVLTDAECLIKIPPYGSATSSVRKPTKYCFMSPALRASLLSIAGSDGTMATRQGKYWEDAVALHLYREFASKRQGTLVYDPSAGGCDFVLQMTNGQQVAIEVGSGEKGTAQATKTMTERRIDRGLVISSQELSLSSDGKIISIPFKFFLLM